MNFKLGKIIWTTSVIVLIAACGSPAPPEDAVVRFLPVMKVGDIAELESRSFPGRARATQEVDLAFRVGGPLITFPVMVGDKVKQDTLLARIDPRDFEVRQRNMEGQLQRAQANHERAGKEYKRLMAIRKKDAKLVSEVNIDRAKEDLDLARADIVALQASLDAAKDSLAYTHLKAPFAGVVVATYVENFESVNPHQAILRLLDNRRVEFVFSVSETLISLVPQIGNPQVTFDAFPAVKIPAEFLEVGSEASATTRTYPVTLIMDQPEGIEILPGMAGKVSGTASKPSDGRAANIVIPINAVFSTRAEEQSYVWVVNETNHTVSRRPVELGNLASVGVTVKSGLQVGELVAVAGVHYLTEGQLIKPSIR